MRLLRILLTVGTILTAGQCAWAETLRSEYNQMQGGWTLLRAERDRRVVDDPPDGSNLVVRGNRYTIGPMSTALPVGGRSGGAESGQITLNSSRWPREIDLTVSAGPDAGKVYRGIYEIVGDTQRVCFAPPGKSRPTSFDAVPGSGQTAYVWRAGQPRIPGPVVQQGSTPQFNYSRYPASPAGYYGGSPNAYPWTFWAR